MTFYPSSKVSAAPRTALTEFDILKASHKFLRDEEAQSERNAKSWNEQLAEKYYANLYREFAVCDLKHYKSGNFALRWRTEDEVLSGAGETTCANTRCEYHHHHPTSPAPPLSSTDPGQPPPEVPLSTLELPFAYEEHGEQKSALVKVVLCNKCVRKLMYKRNKGKEKAMKMERERERAARGMYGDGDDGEGSEEGRKRKKGKSKEVAEGPSATGEDKGRDKKRSQRQEDKHPRSSRSYEREARHKRSSHRSRSAQDGHANFTSS